MNRKVFIKTYGCQMNVYDSRRMGDVLAPLGFAPVAALDDADLVILNTCHIREKAAEKVYSELGRIRQIKRRREACGRTLLVGVAGCVAQAEGEEIVRRAPIVDLVFGPQTYHRLPELLARRAETRASVVETEFPAEDKFDRLAALAGEGTSRGRVTAFVTVQEGCDKFCSFCVVPYTRGAEVSRPVARIEQEVRRLAGAGVKEVTLLGQNVNAYHGAGPGGRAWSLGRLLDHLAAIAGLERLRYTTSHPCDMDDDLIAAHRDNPKLMPYLHLPAQSGSDRILAAMKRRHGATDYLATIGRIRDARPDIALSSDFIVGFPGESEADFAATLELARAVGYASAFSFKYSARPGTPAAERPDQVPEPVKARRLAELQRLLDAQQQRFNAACLGRALDVLLERAGRKPGQLIGRSPYMQAVHTAAEGAAIGDLVRVEIDGVGANSLSAHITGAGPDSLRAAEDGIQGGATH